MQLFNVTKELIILKSFRIARYKSTHVTELVHFKLTKKYNVSTSLEEKVIAIGYVQFSGS